MPHQKKPRLLDDRCASADDLSTDVLANVLGYLDGPKDIMPKRRVCKKWKEAVKITIVPPTDFLVNKEGAYDAMRVMTRALPNLQQIEIGALGYGYKYSDGEDPDERYAAEAETTHHTAHDIGIISNFSKLRYLKIKDRITVGASLNGRYPVFFNFPLLQKLSIQYCKYLKWDLEMLAGLPLLKELECYSNKCLTGNISSLRVLKDTLEKVEIKFCLDVHGNFMDLADFPHLKELKLGETAVTGDIRYIGANDFSSLEQLSLPEGVYGAKGYVLQRISDATDLIRPVYLLKKQLPALKMEDWYGVLSRDSPDSYETVEGDSDTPPFYIYFVKAGPRIGYRWQTMYEDPCEVNWLDPEPDRESDGYEKYLEERQEIESQVNMYRGFHQPPTEEEYRILHEDEEYQQEYRWGH
jgi:hypothetical protein